MPQTETAAQHLRSGFCQLEEMQCTVSGAQSDAQDMI
jgi:hypothetical protein